MHPRHIALALALALPSVALPTVAHAQLIQRDPPADKPADKAGDKKGDKKATEDDDILAPANKPGDKKPDEPVKAAKAKKIGLVGLIPVGDAGKPLADDVTKGLIKELSTSDAFDVTALAVEVQGGPAKTGQDPAAAEQALKDGADLMAKGRAFLEKAQIGKAKAAFEQALVKLEAAAPVLKDAQPLFDAHVGLAEVFARQGQDDEASAELARAAVHNPEQELDSKLPPQFIRSHQLARKDAMAKPKGAILVDVSGAGSKVEIDGRETLLAPVHITEVPAGRHLVRAIREGLPACGIVVEVTGGADVTVSPGFLAADGTSYADVLAQNHFNKGAMEQVQKAAQAAGMSAALVGVVQKNGGQVPVQLLYVDAGGAGWVKLPLATFQADLLDISIESLKAREKAEELAGADKAAAGTFASAAMDAVLEGAAAGKALHTAELKLRYDVKAVPADRAKSRVVGAEDTEDREVVSAGTSGTRQRLDDEQDPYGDKGDTKPMADPDAPLTEQPWFWPAVIGAGVGAAILVLGGGAIALAALGVIPDPRPADKGEVHVNIP